MRKTKRSNSKLLKVVDNTEVSVETKKQQDEDKAYQNFSEKCKELIKGEIRELFEIISCPISSPRINSTNYLPILSEDLIDPRRWSLSP